LGSPIAKAHPPLDIAAKVACVKRVGAIKAVIRPLFMAKLTVAIAGAILAPIRCSKQRMESMIHRKAEDFIDWSL